MGTQTHYVYQSPSQVALQNGLNITLVISTQMNLPHQSHQIILYLKIVSLCQAQIILKTELRLARPRHLHSISQPIPRKVIQPFITEMRPSTVYAVKSLMVKWLLVITTIVRWNGSTMAALEYLNRQKGSGFAQFAPVR